MIEHVNGNILKAKVDAIINPVNCAGVMGAGLAKQIAQKYPDIYKEYKELCNEVYIKLGSVFLHYIMNKPPDSRTEFIISFPTKYHWQDNSCLEDIESGLCDLRDLLREHSLITSVAIPAVGCGLGRLKWGDVKPKIVTAMTSLCDKKILIYEPHK